LRPSVIVRRVTNGFRSEWGAKVDADLCAIVATAVSPATPHSPPSVTLWQPPRMSRQQPNQADRDES